MRPVLALLLIACTPAMSRDRGWVDDAVTRHVGAPLRHGGPDDSLPPGARLDDGLGEDEAVAIALWRNAGFQRALARLGVARAEVIVAGNLPNPTLAFLFPLGPNQLEASASWVIAWLFQRPRKLRAARLDLERVADELVQSGLDLARDVRLAVGAVALAERRVVLATGTLASWREILVLAEQRFQSGDSSRAELEGAQAQAAAAAAEARIAAAQVTEARARLAELVGVELRDAPVVPAPLPEAPAPLETLLARARASRPDARAAELEAEAAAARAGIARARLYDTLATIDVKLSGGEWSLGGSLTLPLFDQGRGERSRAAAETEGALWHAIEVRRSIDREVRVAHARLGASREALGSWRADVLEPARAALRHAGDGFRAGDQPYLIVLDATRRLAELELREAELEADARSAAAELERAVGGKIDATK